MNRYQEILDEMKKENINPFHIFIYNEIMVWIKIDADILVDKEELEDAVEDAVVGTGYSSDEPLYELINDIMYSLEDDGLIKILER